MSILLFNSPHDLHQLKKAAPPSEPSGFGYELYHVNNRPYKTFLRPVGLLRPAGRFLLFYVARPYLKNFFKNSQKGGVQRAAMGLSGVMLAERDRTTTSPTERG